MTPDVGVAALDRDDVFSRYWNDRDHAQRMCAEVLVPDRVDPDYITAVYVSCATPRAATQAICGEVPVEVAGRLFFRS